MDKMDVQITWLGFQASPGAHPIELVLRQFHLQGNLHVGAYKIRGLINNNINSNSVSFQIYKYSY